MILHPARSEDETGTAHGQQRRMRPGGADKTLRPRAARGSPRFE